MVRGTAAAREDRTPDLDNMAARASRPGVQAGQGTR